VSALRIATPHEPVRFIDLGPAERPYPLRGSTLRGAMCVPGPVTYKDREARELERARVRAFRERHGGRVAR
jgi:hypothetical protein